MKSSRQRSGFTLVEVMVCSVLFALFFGFFISAALSSMRAQHAATAYYKALTIARNRIQRARTFGFDSLSLMAETDTPVDPLGQLDEAGAYSRSTLVEPHTNGVPDLMRVTVRVRYPGTRRNTNTPPVTLSTLIAGKM